MVALASDWLRHFCLLLWKRWTACNETWQEERSQCPLPSLCFLGRSERQDGHPGQSVKKVVHCTQVHDMWPFGPLVFNYENKSMTHFLRNLRQNDADMRVDRRQHRAQKPSGGHGASTLMRTPSEESPSKERKGSTRSAKNKVTPPKTSQKKYGKLEEKFNKKEHIFYKYIQAIHLQVKIKHTCSGYSLFLSPAKHSST